MVKVEAILPLVKIISKEKSAYTDAPDKKDPALQRKDLASIDKAI